MVIKQKQKSNRNISLWNFFTSLLERFKKTFAHSRKHKTHSQPQTDLIQAGVELCRISHEARAKGVEPVVPEELKEGIARLVQEMKAERGEATFS